ncbi:MAG: c-type cytochrome [Pseudomonadales bacterium]
MKRWNLLVALGVTMGLAGCGETAPVEPGEQVYNRYCFSCHAAGIAGAPRVGDMAAWAPRLAKGREALLQTTVQGIAPGMPAMGLCSECSDEDLAAAIDYMIVRSVAESQ